VEKKPKYNKFYYKPLPDYLDIQKSDIEGLGLFAKDNIPEDTDLGRFFNHSEDANCYIQEELDWDDYRVFHVYTLRDIQIGEELTLNYHIDQEP
jgi:SET domain-containing protein